MGAPESSALSNQWHSKTYHVLGWRDELDNAVVELCSLPPVRRLVLTLVPVKELRNIVGQSTHAAFPPVASLNERNERVDVRSASPAAGNAVVFDDGHGAVTKRLAYTAVRRENEREGELALAQEALTLGHSVKRAAFVGWVGVDVG